MSNNVIKSFLGKFGRDFEQSGNIDSSFNIFQILGIEAREVLACRFIGWLLEPNGNHGLGRKPVKLFLEHVLGVEDNIDNNISVTLEDHINNDRRVDIVIENGDYIYPIEVKIWAGDQDKQLNDYYNYYFKDKNYKGKKIYYLTPMGWEPSTKSRGKLSDDSIVCVSFNEGINNWLQKIKKIPEINNEVKNIIRQYIGVIKEMCKTEEEKNKILDTVGLNKDTFEITDELCALIMILKANGDKNSCLQRIIQKKYLLANLVCDNEYEITDNVSGVLHDTNAILFVKKCGKTIAWICVDKNLYIGCKEIKESPNQKSWRDKCWAYISPKGTGKKFKLDDCESILQNHGKIDIKKLLDDIKQ